MPHKRRDLAIRAAHRDALVDPARKVRDAVLKVVVRHLHHVRLVLDDRHLRALRELARRIAQAVLRDDRVRVHDEDDLPESDRLAVRRRRPPPLPALLVHLLDRELERAVLERLFEGVLCALTLELHQVLLELERECEAVVHVRRLLETACTLESVWGTAVPWPRDPADVVVRVECHASLLLSRVQELHPILVDEDRGRASLSRVRLHRLLEMIHGGRAVLRSSQRPSRAKTEIADWGSRRHYATESLFRNISPVIEHR